MMTPDLFFAMNAEQALESASDYLNVIRTDIAARKP
jgi:hypothetical protein